ncbi:MAG: Trk family potassium uptake protein [Oscillospiraceae bacterium]|nr:Trk family potassium uptake protein [Oscillospiraceae bacterium]
MLKNKRHWSSAQVILRGFGALILAGTLLLMLPVSSRSGQWTSFTDALFTATSASCVTGLIVQDTATYWSLFGQFVIITLIQIGGLGVVTMAIAIAMASGSKISLSRRQTMQDAISATQVGGIVRMTGFILKSCLIIELVGALAYSFVFIPEFGFIKGLCYSLFHSISAFCNAGFDLMGIKTQFSSLTDYTGNGIVNLTTVMLILTGGLGFATWADFSNHKLKFSAYRLQSKIALAGTVILVAIPFVYFWFLEFSMPQWAGMSATDKFWASVFRAVTPRTAGFNTVDMTLFSEATVMVTILLMLIGGNSGSTAGGMKVSTISVLFTTAMSVFHRQQNPSVFGRRIEDSVIKNAATILMMYITLFMGGALFISIVEGLPLLTCMFETASAVATVGLTMGITPQLSTVSHFILIALMYLGRVGGLTIIFATVKGVNNGNAKYPVEKITVG